jgi:Fe-S oxidoreductase
LIGIEPSAILTFRDEYIRLADDTESAKKLAKNVFTIEEFFKNEITKGKIHAEQFSEEEKLLKFTDIATKVIEYHGSDFAMLNVPKNSSVTIYNSGCCGMAGSFDMKRTL